MSELAAGDAAVVAVRAFNRFYTNMIGLLRGKYLDTPHSLTEARILFELAQRDASEVTDLRRTVDIDAGYLSRILARFSSDGLVTRQRSAADGRRQVITGFGNRVSSASIRCTARKSADRSPRRGSARISRKSWPEQNAGPAPAITTTRVRASAAARPSAATRSRISASDNALRACGRFRVSRRTPPSPDVSSNSAPSRGIPSP